ncbi:Sesquipedalian-1 [Phytophthora citrophthora]|uniref:Sesquipedalian-1 n=1 Tax=Phytophthora citrophthora TaxID=4793 RepID=A0AAD9GL40_9STRA|nr:Sesquipedalian-1 [Phytophthora citrophthora]
MDVARSVAMPATSKSRVAFFGAQVIEYDASLPSVVRLGGASSCAAAATDSLALECEARGLNDSEQLTQRYVDELQCFLRQRGFKPISNDLKELQTQCRVLELLMTWIDTQDKENQIPLNILDPDTLQRAQLAKKQLDGLVDDSYAFGRRFFSVATYVDTLSSEELLTEAKNRGLELPKLDKKQRAAVKAPDRELLGLYGTAEGRPLRTLTLRQLVTEAESRGMLGPEGEKARDIKGKKSKRAWVDILRPVLVTEVRGAKIMEKEEEMLREKLVQEMEQEKQQEQKQRVIELIERTMKQVPNGKRVNTEPEDDDLTLQNDKKNQDVDNIHKYLEALLKPPPSCPHMTTSRGLSAKMSSLHRRQSALNLPPVDTRTDVTSSIGIQPALSLTDVQDDDNTSQGESSPTCRSYRDKVSKTTRLSTGRSPRHFSFEADSEFYDTQTLDTQHSGRGSRARHLRTLSRDFVLPSIPVSSVRHENLSSLKDQFLKIKERFSPSVLPLSSTATVTPSCLVETRNNGESAITETPGTLSTQILSEQREHLNDESWEFPQARVERWYREDDFFKACITCWTMEAGAAIVSKVARVVSGWTDSSSAANTSAINPDVSLQWIGRQLWAVTVSLPLTRSGELHAEHITLAHRINQAVAEVSKQTIVSQIEVVDQPETSPPLTSQVEEDSAEDNAEAIEPPSLRPPLSPIHLSRSNEDSRVDKPSMVETSPFSTLVAEDIDVLRAQRAQLAIKTDGTEDSVQYDEDSTDRGQNDEEDDNEPVSMLPLSWSMLSLSSQPSGSSEHASMQGEFPITDEDSMTDPVAHLAPEKTGWLKKKKRKQHGLGSSWQPRYFELKGNRLYYFASEADGLPRGAVLLDHALVQRGRGDQAMVFSISSASSHRRLQVLKFSARLTHQVRPRKSVELRVVEETEASVSGWVAALNRASFYCKLATASAGSSSTLPAHSSSSFFGPFALPDKKRKTPFYRFRSPTATKAALAAASLSLSVEKERQDVEEADTEELRTTNARWTASYQQLGSVQYLRETDPLLWEIHPPEQLAIRKKAARARTRSDYLAIFSRHAETFAQIFLPRPQPISLEQTLRDILPELFLINDTLYGGGEQQQQPEQSSTDASSQPQQNRGLEHIFEVLDAHIQRFAAASEERVRAVSALLQACARTISGGDSYFVVHRLLGNPNLIIRPAEARGRPIEIDVSPERPSRFLITVFSAFSFHLLDDVERFGDSGGGGMTPAPLLRVRTRHIQEFDFSNGTSTRWLKIDVEGRKEAGSPSGNGGGALGRWGSRRQSHDGPESRIGALLDALS